MQNDGSTPKSCQSFTASPYERRGDDLFGREPADLDWKLLARRARIERNVYVLETTAYWNANHLRYRMRDIQPGLRNTRKTHAVTTIAHEEMKIAFAAANTVHVAAMITVGNDGLGGSRHVLGPPVSLAKMETNQTVTRAGRDEVLRTVSTTAMRGTRAGMQMHVGRRRRWCCCCSAKAGENGADQRSPR